MTLYKDDLAALVLYSPPPEADRLRVVSGYATPAMLSKHIVDLRTRGANIGGIELVVGMTAGPNGGISLDNHRGFVRLAAEVSGARPSVSYVTGPMGLHSKAYVWCDGDRPLKAFIGSANYSQIAFGFVGVGTREEIVQEASPEVVLDYWNKSRSRATECTDVNISSLVNISNHPSKTQDAGSDPAPEEDSPAKESVATATLSLLMSNSTEIHGPGGGLNWGQSRNRSNRNEAYIPVPAHVQASGFFPPKNAQFLVTADDGETLLMSVASGDIGKDLRTPLNNGILGLYFRNRLGVASGERILTDDLRRYGRTDVVFHKLGDEVYKLDFSV